MMGISQHRTHDRNYVGFLGEAPNAKQAFELLEANGDGCSRHEPNHGSV